MKIIPVTQGSSYWATLRAQHNTASEAPAIMGASKYQTRDQLLRQKATGIVPEVSHHQQALFDRGHATEAAARLLLEELTGEDFYPITAVSDDGKLLASVDGITMDDSTLFEHKLFNEKLATRVRTGDLEPHYYWQLEQQLLVTGAQKVIFVCSDGTKDNWAAMEYFPVPGRAEQLQAGWAQFDADKAAYVPPAAEAPAPTGRAPETLPALLITVRGEVTASNLKDFKETALTAIRSVNRELTTDQHFADAEKAVKWCSDIEDRVAGAKQHALSQTATIDQLFKAMDDISAEARQVRLDLDKLVKARKVSLKIELLADVQAQLKTHLSDLDARIGKDYMPFPTVDFAGAIHGKKNFDSMRAALNAALANEKIKANAIADRIQSNLITLKTLASDYKYLFGGIKAIIFKETEDFTALVKTRIAEHQAAELAKLEAICARIRAEEVERLERERVEARRREEENAAATSALQGIEEARRAESMPAPLLDALEGVATNLIADLAVSRAAESSRPLANVVPMRAAMPAPAAQTPPTLKLGQIGERLGFSLTGEFLKNLGFEPAARDKSAILFHEADFALICMRLVAHVQGVQAKQAA